MQSVRKLSRQSEAQFQTAKPFLKWAGGKTQILKEILGISAGPKLGALMQHLCHERAFGRLINLDQTFKEAREWWQHNSTTM